MNGLRGFLVGSLAMVVVYAAVQPRGTRAVEEGGSWLVSGLRRLVSSDIAGVPQLGAAKGVIRRRREV